MSYSQETPVIPIDQSGNIPAVKKFDKRLYPIFRQAIILIYPLASVLYAAGAYMGHLKYPTEVLGSIAFLALITGIYFVIRRYTIERKGYNPSDGAIIVDKTNPNQVRYSLELNEPLESIDGKKSVTFKVV